MFILNKKILLKLQYAIYKKRTENFKHLKAEATRIMSAIILFIN